MATPTKSKVKCVIVVPVLKADIRNGKSDCSGCPVALAINRAIKGLLTTEGKQVKLQASVSTSSISLFFQYCTEYEDLYSKCLSKGITPSRSVRRFINGFDDGYGAGNRFRSAVVRPFKFKFNIGYWIELGLLKDPRKKKTK